MLCRLPLLPAPSPTARHRGGYPLRPRPAPNGSPWQCRPQTAPQPTAETCLRRPRREPGTEDHTRAHLPSMLASCPAWIVNYVNRRPKRGSPAPFVVVGLVLRYRIGERQWIHIHGALLVSASLLSFIPRALRVLRVLPSPDQVTIEAGPRSGSADCPSCGLRSQRIHSGYVRKLRDLQWQGRPVTIGVAARRFRCLNRLLKKAGRRG